MDSNGDYAQRLAEGQFPQWSPDGLLIAFITQKGSKYNLNVMTPLGTESRAIATDVVLFSSWQPGTRKLLYINAGGLMLIDVTGANAPPGRPQVLSALPRLQSAAWSPDGQKIAFTNGKELYVLALATGAAVKVADGAEPAWSDDAKSIAFTKSGQVLVVTVEDLANPPRTIARGSTPLWLPGHASLLYARGTDLFTYSLESQQEALFAQGASAPAVKQSN